MRSMVRHQCPLGSKADLFAVTSHVRFTPKSTFRNAVGMSARDVTIMIFKKMWPEASMVSLVCASRFFAAVIVAAVMLTSVPSRSFAATGSVRIIGTNIGFIVGVGGGSGTLTFRGHRYPLRISGVSAGTIGVAGADLVGTASRLRTAADIAGTYTAASAGIAIAGGAKAATLQNANGVVLTLRGRQVGFAASLSVSGMTISLQ